MVAGPIISKVKRLSGFGVFPRFVCTADVPNFKSHNLVYGFNGSGKTTLSRILTCLEFGEIGKTLPPECKFEIELSNGTLISESENLDYLKGRALVFNVDFIERNLQWTVGTASPVFYIGAEQADLARKLQEADEALRQAKATNETRGASLHSANEILSEFKTNHARIIAEQLNYGRRYNATNLTEDYSAAQYGSHLILKEEELAEKKKMFSQSEPFPEIVLPGHWEYKLTDWLTQTYRILSETIGAKIADDLKKHTGMLPWIKEGLVYHSDHKLANCLFCANELSASRLEILSTAVDSQVGKLIEVLPELKTTAVEMKNAISTAANVPSTQYLSPNLRQRYEAAVAKILEGKGALLAVLDEVIIKIETRQKNVVRIEGVGDLFSRFAKLEHEKKFVSALKTIQEIVELHNTEMKEFEATRAKAEQVLKNHYLAMAEAGYNKRTKTAQDADAAKKTAQMAQEASETAQAEAAAKLRQHGSAAEKITKMIQHYLGHKELEISVLEVGYQIQRYKKPLTGSLSEGEKTAIALCYFLCTLEAESRKVEDLIIIVDDPISSLDTKAMHYALSIIQHATRESGQIIFLTHNANCMNSVKKWLKTNYEDKHSLFFLDVKMEKDADFRSSTICRMPKLLRAFDSEYHYLFKMVADFAKQDEAHSDYSYMLPNAMRRVLEVFLAFKHPATMGIAAKLAHVVKDCGDFDQARLFALEKLTQLESHSDSLEDLLTMSSMSIEETKSAADALLLFMNAADSGHYTKLVDFCAKP